MIEASLAEQYGVRISSSDKDIFYGEYLRLLSCLSGDTALGRVIKIRMERDQRVVSKMGAYERKLRAEWTEFKLGLVTQEQREDQMRAAAMMLKAFAGG